MKNLFSKKTVLSSINAHSILGLSVGVFMYLLCLSGTILVIADAWERWEQPDIPEFKSVQASALDTALNNLVQKTEDTSETLYIVLPTPSLPRMHVANNDLEWWTDEQGNIVAPTHAPWTELVKNIHIYLHMPETFGLLIVSIIGAIFIGLILSGIVAHPSIIKDAFKFRFGRNKRLELLDIHNRLSVWALPFHLMIGITGAFFGLVGLLVIISSYALYDGDRDALIADVYGSDPVVNEAQEPINFAPALGYLEQNYPSSAPIYVAIHNYNTEQQFFELATTFPQSLAYSEIFRFHSSGAFLNKQELIGGPIGRQVLYSVYRLHFGWFGGLGIQLLYIVLGLSLTIVSVTGINMWLNKKSESWLHRQWLAITWGFPTSLALASAGGLVQLSPIYILLVIQLLFCLYSGTSKKPVKTNQQILVAILGASLIAIPSFQFINSSAWASVQSSLLVNLLLLFSGLALGFLYFATAPITRKLSLSIKKVGQAGD